MIFPNSVKNSQSGNDWAQVCKGCILHPHLIFWPPEVWHKNDEKPNLSYITDEESHF